MIPRWLDLPWAARCEFRYWRAWWRLRRLDPKSTPDAEAWRIVCQFIGASLDRSGLFKVSLYKALGGPK